MEIQLKIFTDWFLNQGGYLHPAVEFAFGPSGVYLRRKLALSNCEEPQIESGSSVVLCTHQLTLSALDAHPDFPQIPLHDTKLKNGQGVVLPHSLISTAPRSQCIAALWLCVQQTLGDKSFWTAYIDLLPVTPAIPGDNGSRIPPLCQELDTPLYWDDQEKSWFESSSMEAGIRNLGAWWKREYDAWLPEIEQLRSTHGVYVSW